MIKLELKEEEESFKKYLEENRTNLFLEGIKITIAKVKEREDNYCKIKFILYFNC